MSSTSHIRANAWRRSFASKLFVTDIVVIVLAIGVAQAAWSRSGRFRVNTPLDWLSLDYTIVSVVLILGWIGILGFYGTREYRVIGVGSAEFKRIIDASFRLFGLFAIVVFLLGADLGRGYILTAFPFGLLGLLLGRYFWRRWLNHRRQHGEYSARVLLVGSQVSVEHIAEQLGRSPEAGYKVVAACIPTGVVGDYLPISNIPIIGNVDHVLAALEAADADTVVVTSSDELSPARIRELSWSLEPGQQHLVVAPSLTDIGGPRIHTRPVAGLPLVHVETPTFVGRRNIGKRAFDVVGSFALIVVLLPLFAILAMVVRLSSPGKVFYSQERIGQNGRPFQMLKFRSMVEGADAQLLDLLKEQGSDDKPLFKVANDPRVTPIGRILRKYSLDEFPQLFNVLRGDMSLVGPRPQREGEVALYDLAASRRLFVKPGMSGLWQVSGRSDLSWEDSIRLDLYYVENWSITGDIAILWKTLRAVLMPGGAY